MSGSIPVSESARERPRLQKGQTVTVRIASLAAGGEGVTRELGTPIFVNRVAPGDSVEVQLFDVRKDFARGEVTKLIEPSDQRAVPFCPYFKVCGGCQWQHIKYENQLDAKADIMRQALKHIGKLDPALVLPTIGAADPVVYRNKVQFPVESVRSTGRVLAGYYKQNSHELVNIKHCPVQPESLDRGLAAVKELLEKYLLTIYDETTGKGLVRHIAERYSYAAKKVLITLVLNYTPPLSEPLHEKLTELAQTLMETVPEVSGVCVNYNNKPGNRIMGDTTECIAGQPYLIETLRSHLPNAPQRLKDGLQFRLSSTSFFQVNSAQAEVLLDQVLLAATSQTNADREQARFEQRMPLVLDAYAGVGTMAMWMSELADRVIAIEEVAASVEDGEVNLGLNNIENVDFAHARVEDEVPALLEKQTRADVLVVDPPRKGIDARGLNSIIELAPRRIVYVSCNPATLARDLKILQANGYDTKRVQPIDMFPQTYHVESVTLLEKSGAN